MTVLLHLRAVTIGRAVAAVMGVRAVAEQEDLLVEVVTAAGAPMAVRAPMAGETIAAALAMNVGAVRAVVMIASRKTVHH